MRFERGESTEPTLSEDKKLALAFQNGEPDAYKEIYRAHCQRVEMICRRMLSDPHDAQEASQEAFLRVYQGLPRFNGRYQLGAWIARVTTNVCLDHLRARQRRPSDPFPLEDLDLESPDFSIENDPEGFVLKRSEGRRVRRILDSLPPLHRAAIVLRDFEGFSYDEVASTLKISECQVKALLHRARKNFRRSWTSLASALLPARLLHRIRKVDHDGDGAVNIARAGQHLGDVAGGATHAASSCGVMLQQCGQFVGERFAAVATSVVVGAAAVGGGVHAARSQDQAPETHVVEIAGESTIAEVDPTVKPARIKKEEATTASPTTGTGTVEEPPPSTTPQPAPTPTPTTGSPSGSSQGSQGGQSSGGNNSQSPSNAQKPVSNPYEFKPAVGFDRGSSLPTTVSKSFSVKLDCTGKTIEQTFETTFWDGDAGYAARVYFRASAGAGRVEVDFTKDGTQYRYSSWGKEPVATWAVESGKASLEVAGSYGPPNGSADPAAAGLPTSGTFSAKLSIDCAASTVTTENITFSAS